MEEYKMSRPKLNLTNKLRKAEREYNMNLRQGGGEKMVTTVLKKYDPIEKMKNLIAIGYDEDSAKQFVNKTIRKLKALSNNETAKFMAVKNGNDPECWATLEELA